MYCLLGIALYSIYSTDSTFQKRPVSKLLVIKLIRVMSASKMTANKFPVRDSFLLLMTHEIVYVTK